MRRRSNHNYKPEWDFDLRTKPSAAVARAVAHIAPSVQDISELLGLGPVSFHYADLSEQEHLARYVNGTSDAPVVIIDDKLLEATAKAQRVPLRVAVATTLVHEMGHAYVDSVGLSGELDDEEDIVESAARFFFETGAADSTARFIRDSVDAVLED